ncbi:MAG: hypothetical protein RSG56_10845, partial [Brevundimonas sp.]
MAIRVIRNSALRCSDAVFMKIWSLPLVVLALGLSQAATAQDRASLEIYVEALARTFVDDPDGFVALYGAASSAEGLVRADIPRTSGEPRIIRLNERTGTATV